MNYNELEKIMRPGQLSECGFLGHHESLADILEIDNKTVKKLGISHKIIADKLEYLVKAAVKIDRSRSPSLRNSMLIEKHGILVDGKYLVRIIIYFGDQECPWYDGHSSFMDVTIINKKTKQKIFFPELIIHLIRKHRFYEGKGTKYRLDPEKAVRVLDLQCKT